MTASSKTADTTVELTVSTTAIPQIRGTGKTGTTKVDGATATTYSVPPHEVGAAPYGTTPPDADGATESLTFQRKPGQWIRVFAHLAGGTQKLDVTAHDLRRTAENLVDRERRVPDLVHIANPNGLQMAFSRYDSIFGATVGFMLTSGPPPQKQWILRKSGEKCCTPVMIYLGPRSETEAAAGYSPKDPVLQTIWVGDRTRCRGPVDRGIHRGEGETPALILRSHVSTACRLGQMQRSMGSVEVDEQFGQLRPRTEIR